jgi:AAA domain
MNPPFPIEKLIQEGRLNRAQRIVEYGPLGIGKTWLATQFPDPVLFDTEDGSLQYNVKRIRALNSDDFFNALRVLTKAQKPEFKTLVVDTIDMAEKFIRDRILRIHRLNGLEDFGYGKGWTFLREEFERFLSELDKLITCGIHVVIVGHSTVKRYQPPLAETGYDRFQLKLYEANSNRLMEWADAVLFVNWDTHVVESRNGKPRGVGGRVRVIHTQHSAGWDAKVRVDLPEKLPCEFGVLLPLFGPQEKEVIKEQGPAAGASASAENTAPPLPTNPDLRDQLLSAIGDLENELVCRYLSRRKLIPADGSIDDLSENQARWIVDHTAEFRARVEKFANQPF